MLEEILKSKLDFDKPKIFSRLSLDLFMRERLLLGFKVQQNMDLRALGNRSILTKPFPLEMKNFVNNQVKPRKF